MRQVKKVGFVLTLLFCVICVEAQNNAIAEPRIWFRSDLVGQGDQWEDASGNGYAGRLQQGGFDYRDGLLNFQPCLVFDSLSEALFVDYRPLSTSDWVVFVVYESAAVDEEEGIWMLRLDSMREVGLSSQGLRHFETNITYSDSSTTDAVINLIKIKWINEEVDTNVSELRVVGSDSLNFRGKFAEFMVYDSCLSFMEVEKIHTYLAIKYGISMEDLNYVDSEERVLWNYDEQQAYSHDIAGIGHDTLLQIDQKQSCGRGGKSDLTISAGELRSTNAENEGEIAEHDFLLWGCNGLELTSISPDTLDTVYVNGVSACRWMMRRTGETANEINTVVKIHAPAYAGMGMVNLIINRSGDFLFPLGTSIVLPSDSVDTLGNHYFKGIYWDTDGSGVDAFGFQLMNVGMLNERNSESPGGGSEGTMEDANGSVIRMMEVYPNPSDGRYIIRVRLEEEMGVELSIQDEQGKIIRKESLWGSKEYMMEGWLNEKGCYLVKLEAKGAVKTVKIIIQ